LTWSAQSTGIDEDHIFLRMPRTWTLRQLGAEQTADLAALRRFLGWWTPTQRIHFRCKEAVVDGRWPLASQKTPTATASYYFGDAHALHTLDLKLIAGRNFSSLKSLTETRMRSRRQRFIITRALAKRLFPGR